jgi:hypothetical protein
LGWLGPAWVGLGRLGLAWAGLGWLGPAWVGLGLRLLAWRQAGRQAGLLAFLHPRAGRLAGGRVVSCCVASWVAVFAGWLGRVRAGLLAFPFAFLHAFACILARVFLRPLAAACCCLISFPIARSVTRLGRCRMPRRFLERASPCRR